MRRAYRADNPCYRLESVKIHKAPPAILTVAQTRECLGWLAALAGVLAGFTTMVANAAGPVMVIYLLAVGLPKLEFIGTGAWFFMLVNAFKVPFSVHLGLITFDSLKLDAVLLLPMIPGALLGPVILRRINQAMFESMALVLTVIAVARLLFF